MGCGWAEIRIPVAKKPLTKQGMRRSNSITFPGVPVWQAGNQQAPLTVYRFTGVVPLLLFTGTE